MKKCSICQIEKNDIYKSGKCKLCNTEYIRKFREKNKDKIKKYQQKYDNKYYEENKNAILNDKKVYYEQNKKDILENRKEYYQENKDEKQKYNKIYYQNNRSEIINNVKIYYIINKKSIQKYHNIYNKNKRLTNPNFKIKAAISANINFHLKSNRSCKDGNICLNYLSYTIQELKEHLEKQFEPWMTWDNYGRYNAKTWDDSNLSTWKWQIDHIKPQSTFKYTSMDSEEFKKCWNLTNLRPLSSKQNFLDGVSRIRH